MNKQITRITAMLLLAAGITSCGDKKAEGEEGKDSTATVEEKPAPAFADVCKDENAMTMTIKGYGYGMSDKKYAYETTNFEVKQSSWTMKTDSTATLKLSNYTAADLVGDRKDDQVDIMVEFRAKGGKKIEAASFVNGDYQSPMNCTTTMITAKGTVYFNWLAGMPESGNVKLNFVDADHVCGSFTLAAEKPDSDMIGTVRLNGTFKVGE